MRLPRARNDLCCIGCVASKCAARHLFAMIVSAGNL